MCVGKRKENLNSRGNTTHIYAQPMDNTKPRGCYWRSRLAILPSLARALRIVVRRDGSVNINTAITDHCQTTIPDSAPFRDSFGPGSDAVRYSVILLLFLILLVIYFYTVLEMVFPKEVLPVLVHRSLHKRTSVWKRGAGQSQGVRA